MSQWAKFEMHGGGFAQGIAPVSSVAATVVGSGIDQQTLNQQGGPFSSAVALLSVGAASGTPTSFTATMKIQDSADDSTYADVTDTALLVEAASVVASAVATQKQLAFRLKGLRRYVRASVTIAFVGGTTPAIVFAVDIILGGARRI